MKNQELLSEAFLSEKSILDICMFTTVHLLVFFTFVFSVFLFSGCKNLSLLSHAKNLTGGCVSSHFKPHLIPLGLNWLQFHECYSYCPPAQTNVNIHTNDSNNGDLGKFLL